MKTIKQIERTEVQEVLVSLFMGDIFPVTAYKKIYALAGKTMMSNKELYDWFNSDYVELHKWKKFELEILCRITKNYKFIGRRDFETVPYVSEDNKDFIQDYLPVHLDSLKNGERFEIDKELERYGMYR